MTRSFLQAVEEALGDQTVSTSLEIVAVSIGARAYAACQPARLARVIGVTSRGLFILTSQQIIFLSFERYRSPLTINLDRIFDRLRTIEIGAPVQLSHPQLSFPSIACSISLSAATLWHCPPSNWPPQPRAEQLQRLRVIALKVLAQAGRTGWAGLLPKLLDLPGASTLSGEQAMLFARLSEFRRAVQQGDSQQLLIGLLSLLGLGSGLTPSGDDATIGLLLMLARFSRSENMLKHTALSIVAEAYQKTTVLSANLIECAVTGQGDERLIALADGIASGSVSVDDCVAAALGWGNSSGLDALVGMAVAITSL